jgi:cytochrome c oxidase subunit 4
MSEHQGHEHSHHIVSFETCMKVFVALLILTVVTVLASRVDLGAFNFTVAMLIATVKAAVVVAFFMGLKYDSNENRAIFFSSFIFLFIFIFLTFSDLLFRPTLESSTFKLDQIPALVTPEKAPEASKASVHE